MQLVDMYEHFRFINKLLFVAWVFGWWIKLRNFILNNFDLIIRTSDEARVEHHQHSTKFLSSYHMIKHFEKILIECPNIWRRNINQVQYSWVSKCQHSSTVVCKFNHMYVHVQEKISKSKHNQLKSEKISKIFQSPTSIKPSWKNFKKFSKSSSSQLGLKKFQKISKSNSSKTWMKKFLSFKCLVEKCEKVLKIS